MTDSIDSPDKSLAAPVNPARTWGILLAAALAAALVTWAAGESLMISETGSGSRGGRIPISPVVFSTRNGMTSIGILGGSLGLALGLAGGVLRGSARAAGFAALVGGGLGGAAGAGAARVLVPVYFRHYAGADLSLPLLVHGGLWAPVAFTAGLAFGLGLGGPRRGLEAGIVAIAGALVATLTYELAGIWLFPAAQTDRPIPMSSGSRLFADLIVSLMTAAALALGLSRKRASSRVAGSTAS
jgi:hypothetical protein